MRSRLPLAKVQYYQQSDEPSGSESEEFPEKQNENRVSIEYFEPRPYRISLTTGYTYQLGGYEGLPSSYKSQVQSLWSFGGEFNYFISDNIGIGAKYSHIYTKANEDFGPPFSTAFGFSSLRDEKIRFNYFGVSLIFRNFTPDDQIINYYLSGGIIKYRTDGLGDGVPFYQEGDTFGFILGVSYDFILMKYFGLGFGAELNVARMSEFDNNGTVVLTDFNLTRFDFTIGIRLFR